MSSSTTQVLPITGSGAALNALEKEDYNNAPRIVFEPELGNNVSYSFIAEAKTAGQVGLSPNDIDPKTPGFVIKLDNFNSGNSYKYGPNDMVTQIRFTCNMEGQLYVFPLEASAGLGIGTLHNDRYIAKNTFELQADDEIKVCVINNTQNVITEITSGTEFCWCTIFTLMATSFDPNNTTFRSALGTYLSSSLEQIGWYKIEIDRTITQTFDFQNEVLQNPNGYGSISIASYEARTSDQPNIEDGYLIVKAGPRAAYGREFKTEVAGFGSTQVRATFNALNPDDYPESMEFYMLPKVLGANPFMKIINNPKGLSA